MPCAPSSRADGAALMGKQTHGMVGTPEYRVWASMIARCKYKGSTSFRWYGARGVKVCERWAVDFLNFLADVGKKPAVDSELDRIDPNGNYEPGNVRWVPKATQINNRGNTRFVVYRGVRTPLTEAVRAGGNVIHYESAAIRIFRCGWPVELAVETPPDPNHHRTRADRR